MSLDDKVGNSFDHIFDYKAKEKYCSIHLNINTLYLNKQQRQQRDRDMRVCR